MGHTGKEGPIAPKKPSSARSHSCKETKAQHSVVPLFLTRFVSTQPKIGRSSLRIPTPDNGGAFRSHLLRDSSVQRTAKEPAKQAPVSAFHHPAVLLAQQTCSFLLSSPFYYCGSIVADGEEFVNRFLEGWKRNKRKMELCLGRESKKGELVWIVLENG